MQGLGLKARGAKIAAAVLALGSIAGGRAGAATSAVAPADFYARKTVEIDVGTGPGGGYDATARLVAAHLGAFIPGHPTVVVVNVPGGGGIREANQLFYTSARDGTAIGTFSNAMITAPLLGADQTKFQPDKFEWIGSPTREPGVCVFSKATGVASFGDLTAKQIIVGADAPGTTTFMYPAMLKNLFGAKLKVVAGYQDGGQIALALERGEVQGICQTWSSLKVGHPDWLRDGVVTPIVALGLARIADLPNVPTVMEFAKQKAQQDVLETILTPTVAGRPFAFPPGTPQDRVEAVRSAFAAMMKDPSFIADAKKSRMDLDPASGADIAAHVRQIYALPKDVVAEAKRAATLE
jgi:tripartite-type tricarboxylate transporter receptor subunit TctC